MHLLQQFGVAPLRRRGRGICVEAQRTAARPLLDDFFQSDKCAAADKEDVRRIHRRKFLMRMLAAALWRHIGNRAFQNLQQRLLHTFAGNVARDRGVLVLLRDFINLVYINDPLLRLLHVSVGGLQQLQNDVLHVFADVTRFRKRRGIHDCEGHIEHPRKRLRQQSLARARGTDQQNIGLAQFDVARLLVQENPLVVVVYRDREFFLGAVLPDDVAIQKPLDFRWAGQLPRRRRGLLAFLIFQNRLANPDALVADIGARIVRRRTDELFDLLLCLMAEGTAQGLVWVEFFHWCEGLVSAGLRRSLYPLF